MADWYYARDDEQFGPVSYEELQELAATGDITPETLVWGAGLSDWATFGALMPGYAPAALDGDSESIQQAGQDQAVCIECNGVFDINDMVPYAGTHVCATCKPLLFQRIKEGVPLPSQLSYGGFWIRFGAKFVDGLILGAAALVVSVPTMMLTFAALEGDVDPVLANVLQWIANIVNTVIGTTYTTYFVGRFGATPGKMACGLRVIRPDGAKVTYLRAFARHFAEMLSAWTLLIGYIMAAFDDEKRALHDRICDTRVVRK